jgi:LPS-assembly protein
MLTAPVRISASIGSMLLLLLAAGMSHQLWAQDAVPELNWRPLSELSPEQLAKVPSACCGAYVAPALDITDEDNAGWRINADRVGGNFDLFIYEGNVVVRQGQQQIEAHRVTANEKEQTADIEGPITINESETLFRGQRAFINRETGAAIIEDGQFVLYASRLRGSAERIDRDENQVMSLTEGQFTQCEPGNESWTLKGSAIKIDPVAQQGSIRNMRLELGGVPVIYLPYWTFPTGDASKSGFLYPSLSLEQNYGIKDIAVPYYFNLAPNADLIVAPRYINDRGAMLELEARHLNRHFDTVFAGAWLGSGDDDISDNEREAIDALELTEAQATEFDGQDRWLLGVQQRGGSLSEGPRQARAMFGTKIPRWFSDIDYTRVSDYAYFRHINTTNLDINRETHLRQQGDLGYKFSDWRINLHAEAYQSIVLNGEEPYRQVPRVEADGTYRFGKQRQWLLTLNNEVTEFTHREDFFNDNPADPRITGQRTRLDYGFHWDKRWLWGFLNPGLALKSVSYQLDAETLRPGADDQPGITVPQASLDGGLFFERDGSWFGANYLQTFEPRLFYFYSQFEDQSDFFNLNPRPTGGREINFDTNELTFGYNQLFRDSRFAGGDRIDDADQLSVGLTSRFLGRNSGKERLRLSLGQIYYFEDPQVYLDSPPAVNEVLQGKSEIAGQIATQLTDSLQLTGDALFDPHQHQWNQRGVNARYYDQQQRIVNLGYRYVRNPSSAPLNSSTPSVNQELEQAELSFVLPIAGNWSVIGRTYHDFTNDEALDSMFGVEYTSCCYRVRAIGRRWFDNELIELVNGQNLEHERGIFFEFQLRGLGSVFDTINGVLSESIVNYERRAESLR